MANHTANNSKVFALGLKQFTEQQVKSKLLAMCKSVAQTIVGVIDGSFAPPFGTQQFPIWSNNLHDATGVGVYYAGDVIDVVTARGRNRHGVVNTARDIEMPLTHELLTKIEIKQGTGD
nr:hypothetical protein [Bacteroides acidifaciens]